MKKTVLTIAIVLGITLAGMAQGNGLFGRGQSSADDFGYGYYNYGYYDESATRDGMIALPSQHGSTDDQTPLAGGALLLIGFGAAYALKKRNEK
ncbi:MAG: hypothetical protein II887_00095 [Bacteroidales bacterium]|nr:hypothetical protein [Bacteroidales bacterium]